MKYYLVSLLVLLLITGCGDSGTNSSQNPTWTVEGKITEQDGTTPLTDATIAINATNYNNQMSPDSQGNYQFTDVPTGSCTVYITKTDYITVKLHGEVSSNYNFGTTGIPTKTQWETLLGPGHYNPGQGYIIINAQNSYGDTTPVAGVNIAVNPMSGVSTGYINGSTIDWDTTITYASGKAILTGLTPSTVYSVMVIYSSSRKETITNIKPSANEIDTYFSYRSRTGYTRTQ